MPPEPTSPPPAVAACSPQPSMPPDELLCAAPVSPFPASLTPLPGQLQTYSTPLRALAATTLSLVHPSPFAHPKCTPKHLSLAQPVWPSCVRHAVEYVCCQRPSLTPIHLNIHHNNKGIQRHPMRAPAIRARISMYRVLCSTRQVSAGDTISSAPVFLKRGTVGAHDEARPTTADCQYDLLRGQPTDYANRLSLTLHTPPH